jgi:hypothetical protein
LKISKIILYDEPTVPQIRLEKLEKFITDTSEMKVESRKNIFLGLDEKDYKKIASCRIFDLKKPFQTHNPTPDEIQIENQNKDMSNKEEMTLYDGFELQKTTLDFISKNERDDKILHIIFSNKLVCTFDENDFRYHARAVIGSNPTIISTTGMVEAPAKPKRYYLDLMTDFNKERIDEIKEKYKGEFLEYNDSRISDIAEGYLLQAIMYYHTGEAFCENKECRLFNAHWQKDLFYSQLENKKFCDNHQKILKNMTNQD